MNTFQYFGFFISVGYMFYVLWLKYNYQNFFNKKRLLLNLLICICWASFGLTTNYSSKSGSFFIPLTLIFLIRIFDFISIKIRKTHFRPCYGKNMPANANVVDAILTLFVIFLNIILPIIILNFVINGKTVG
jgi:hypothetical protein